MDSSAACLQPAPAASTFAPSRAHKARLLHVWRSAGWPCRDGLEIDLLAADLLVVERSTAGVETLKLTPAAMALLAADRQRNRRALSKHDRLALRMATLLQGAGRIVWRELSLRALVQPCAAATPATEAAAGALWDSVDVPAAPARASNTWRMARPDLFSVRNTTVANYLQPMVHEIKTSRADLQSDLRHDAKRQSYRWLCSECYYVFPAGIASADEIPPEFGVWLLHGDVDSGRLELLRPAQHTACTLPFAVWMGLAKATPLYGDGDPAQTALGAQPGAMAESRD